MQVRFDSLNRFEIPTFYVCNPGCVYENNTLTNVLGCISGMSDEELIMNFNTTSELNMRVHKIHVQDPEEDAHIQKIYKALQNRRLIFVEDVGFFVITNVIDGYEAGLHYKDIQAASCEYELGNRVLPYIEDGTYKFTDLLEKIVSSLPVWKIGEVNGNIANKHRTFEDVSIEQNALSFMLEDMQDAYECIFEYDCVRRLINVYDQNSYVRQTSIHLTKDDLINSVEITENSDDLYTAISVQGDENLNISPVNPLGTNIIYNFDYYLDWMTPALREKVITWQNLVRSKLDAYYDLNLDYYSGLTDKTGYSSELSKLEIQLTMYQRCRDNIVASGSTVSVKSYNEVIEKNGGVPVGVQNEIAATLSEIDKRISNVKQKISDTENEITATNNSQAIILEQINAVHDEVNILSYFTDEEYSELCNYIFEGSYTDEYIAVTNSMTHSERFQQMKTLYDRAVAQLERISSPTQEFDLDVENFIFSKKFESWSNELETGSLINVELETNDVAALFLSNITVNYDDKKLTMTFGNRFNRFDPKSMFNDVLGDIKKSANSIGYIKETLYPVKNGEFDAMREAIESSGVLTKEIALESSNQEFLIDDTGILGRKMLDDGTYDDRQVKITNQTIVFTDDGWNSSRTALGNFQFNNPLTGQVEDRYGVLADTLIAPLILSEEVGIYNTDNSITLDQDGITITSDCTGYFTKANVFTIQKKIDVGGVEQYEKQLYIDNDGNVVINGTISIFTSSDENYASSSLGSFVNSTNSSISDINKNIKDIDENVGIIKDKMNELDEFFLFIRYSPYSDGRDMTEAPNANTVYMGTSYQATNVAPTDPAEYEWVKIRGEDGMPGKPGDNGVSQYLHIKYSNDIINKVFTGNNGEDIGKYIGILVDETAKDSTNFDDYTWKLWTEDVAEELANLQKYLEGKVDGVDTALQDQINGATNDLKDMINKEIAGVKESIADGVASVEGQIQAQYSQVQADIQHTLNNYKAEVGQYLIYDENGLTLGAIKLDGAESVFKTVIDNQGMYFKQDDTPVSYIRQNQLYIPHAVIENTLTLGNFFFAPRDDGGVSLTWQD